MKWFIIEGNIGSGKTTLIRKLKGNEEFEVIEEPVELWRSIKDGQGKNLLDYFYSDIERYSYLFQTMVFKTRLMSLDTPQEKEYRFSERSIWTDKHIFGKNCIESGTMNEMESACYSQWYNWLETHFKPKPTGIIYISCDPEKCLERIKKRGREEESSISMDYLKNLHNNHEDWLNNWTETPMLKIDNNIDDQWNSIMDQVNDFIKKTN
jgi:deoxyadenosine/deoxycytidine kinase